MRALCPSRPVVASSARGPGTAPPNCLHGGPDVYDSDDVVNKIVERTRDNQAWRMPRDLLIAGGRAIGVGFATVFAAVCVKVTLLHRGDYLVPAMDGEIADLLANELDRLGVAVALGETLKRVTRIDGRLIAELDSGETLFPDSVLCAVGRSVNIEGLGRAVAHRRGDRASGTRP